MELDKIITGDSAVVLQSFPPDCIDLTVTSPPYDNLRTYNGFTFDFETIAKELFRVTKVGGVVVWVVGDQTKSGNETLTSFKQAIYFQSVGFNVETMIYEKKNYKPTMAKRYDNVFEYIFVFSKGAVKTFNPIMVEKARVKAENGKYRQKDGSFIERRRKLNQMKKHTNIFSYSIGGHIADKIAFRHPAIFPEALAQDHILSWSNENDTVLDCFCGSGTTPKTAKLLNRHYIGIETSAEYVELANERLAQVERGLTKRAVDDGY